jgi:ABC-type glycerol-3-phosphate transport system substrate-binding protein
MQRFKIIVSIILALAALAVLLFGPRPGATRPTDRVVVTYWEKWTNKEADQMKQIVNDFNNTVGKEKGIFVEYLSMSSINQKTSGFHCRRRAARCRRCVGCAGSPIRCCECP